MFSLLAAFIAGAEWETWLYFLNATPFGRTDPVLGRDIGFYVFTLPLLEGVHELLLVLTLVAAVGTLVVYVLGEEVGLEPARGVFVSRRATRHLGVLAALLFLVLGFGAWLQIPQLLTRVGREPDRRDLRRRPCADARAVGAGRRRGAERRTGAVAGVHRRQAVADRRRGRSLRASSRSAAAPTPPASSGSWSAPNEQVRETPFITHNIQATRAAYGLDGVDERPLTGDAHLTRADLDRNAATIANVPLWNDRPLLDTFGQIQEIRTYYDFVAVDNDRYMIDGQYRQIMLSARELNSASLPSRTWINEHLTFTHGYGLTLGPVNEVTREGLPVLFIQRPAAGVDGRPEGDAAGDLFRRAAERSRLRQDARPRSSTTRAARPTCSPPTPAAAACRSRTCSGG